MPTRDAAALRLPSRSERLRRAAWIGQRLAVLYPDPAIPLDHRDPFTLLVAVVLSAQCTDRRVNQVTPLLFAHASHPAAMAALDPEAIRDIIRPCGLAPAKARALHGLSVQLLERHSGQVPEDWEALEALPGVGHKTASVVMAQAFGHPALPVDTHIHRLAKRWRLSNGISVTRTERDLKEVFPESAWIRLHLRIVYYGREHCTARRCDGHRCPICAALAAGTHLANGEHGVAH